MSLQNLITNTGRGLVRQLPRAWRLAQVLGALALIGWIGLRWLEQGQESRALLNSQSEVLAQQLLSQSAIGINLSLAPPQEARLGWLVSNLVKDPQVVSATVFNHEGYRLATAQSLFPEARLPAASVLDRALNTFTPYSTPLMRDNEVVGYLRIRVNQALMFHQQRQLLARQQEQQHQLLMLAALAGLVLARALSLKRAHYRALLARQVDAS